VEVERTMTREVVTCGPEDSLERAARAMLQRDCGGLPVVDRRGRVIGMVTDRDICMAALTRGRPLRELCVRDAMTREVVSAAPGQSLALAAELMGQCQVRRLPVLDESHHPVGVISLGDLARRADCGEPLDSGDVGMDDVTAALAAIARPGPPAALPRPAPPHPHLRPAHSFPRTHRSLAGSRRPSW
jgi:CBS domain-containing protein